MKRTTAAELQRLQSIEAAARFMVEYTNDSGMCAVCNLSMKGCEEAECPGHDLRAALNSQVES